MFGGGEENMKRVISKKEKETTEKMKNIFSKRKSCEENMGVKKKKSKKGEAFLNRWVMKCRIIKLKFLVFLKFLKIVNIKIN